MTTESRETYFRTEFAKEAETGFPLLSRIPATNVVQFVDYVDDLDVKHRHALLDELARQAVSSVARNATRIASPAIERMRAALRGPGEFVGGWRYTDVKFLATVPKVEQFGGMDAWLENYGARALQPRADLIPDTSSFVPAKAPLLRRIVDTVLVREGFAATAMAGNMRYLDRAGVLVDVDFGSRMAQLRWSVAVGAMKATRGLVELPFFSYEGWWGLRSDWDVLTEENAAGCVEALPAVIREALRMRDEATARTA
ncbi:MAG: hypothetical protein ABI585_09755 [Betaproteobacteria bacterium]